jgi:glycerol-3-phosphate dehydrogenase (NAD(P)+)
MPRMTILGAGVMGGAMAMPAADSGLAVDLVGTPFDGDIVAAAQQGRPHPRLKVVLPVASAQGHDRLGHALTDDTQVILLGVSSAGIDWAIDQLATNLKRPIPVLMITKGLRAQGTTIEVLPKVVAAALQTRLGFAIPVAGIAGPCIAGELAARRPTGTVFTSDVPGLARDLASRLVTPYYQPRVDDDLIGVEACAALKNFFAIAVGSAAGNLEREGAASNGALMNNPAATLFAQSLAELALIVGAMGGKPATVMGMPGAGDLYVTCQAGRNSRLGKHLGLGMSFAAVKAGPMRGETIEGAETGIVVAGALRGQMAAGRLDPSALPVTRALLASLVEGAPFAIDWSSLHGGASAQALDQ